MKAFAANTTEMSINSKKAIEFLKDKNLLFGEVLSTDSIKDGVSFKIYYDDINLTVSIDYIETSSDVKVIIKEGNKVNILEYTSNNEVYMNGLKEEPVKPLRQQYAYSVY